MVSGYEHLATGRTSSMFRADVAANDADLTGFLRGTRVAIVGGAGSIGASVLRQLLRYRLRSVCIIDPSENNLVELVRDLRSTAGLVVPADFEALPIALGSMEARRYFAESRPFDIVLNLAAMKHVRSEKSIYSLIRMIDTNVLFPLELMQTLPAGCRKFFSVSSDKSTAPASVMGASKMVMEKALALHSDRLPISSARFANVAFSDGSLPHGFLKRIEKRQPLSAPYGIRRFFMSHEEAGEICVLSCALARNREVFFPKMLTGADEKTFTEIALSLLEAMGYEGVVFSDEEEAKRKFDELSSRRKWPCFFFQSDTSGEKEAEVFYGAADPLDLTRFASVGVVQQALLGMEADEMEEFLRFATAAREQREVTIADYLAALCRVVPGFAHVEKGKNLDQRM